MTFNGHYAVPPTGFYTQPPSIPPFNTPSFQYGIPPPIPPAANVQRFEANAQVPNPPMPYWNPEILKQLSQLPVPPPPPPIPHTIGTPPFIQPLSSASQFHFQNTNNDRIDDLHEKAKEAITDLSPHVRYQDLLNEGISPSVLDKLYAELNIEKDQPSAKPLRKSDAAPVAGSPSEPVPEAPREPVAEPNVDPGLERKDRIARLLAAKKGRVNTGTNSPVQASTPEVPPVVPEIVTETTPGHVSTPMPNVPMMREGNTPSAVEETSALSIPTITSPLSSRDAKMLLSTSHAFSIPGLFMTADDHSDSGIVQTRPKVNTDKLNARLAALKADMLRKKALQDGMPVLNAEVEKTRDRLTEQRNRLEIVREDILTKKHELSQARDEEARLLEEIEHLSNQLVEGENGQKQFNRELTKLNDQITEQQKGTKTQASVTSMIDSVSPPHQSPTSSLSIPSRASNDEEDVRNETGEGISLGQSTESLAETNGYVSREDVTMEEACRALSENIEGEPSYETQSTHLTTTATPSNNASIHETDGDGDGDGDDDGDDDDDEQMSIDGVDVGESGGSASMSDSGSEYEPAVDQFDTQIRSMGETGDDDDDDEYDPQRSDQLLGESQIRADNDEYEPSERLDSVNLEKVHEVHHDGHVSTQANFQHEEEQAMIQSSVEVASTEEAPLTSTFPTRHSSVDRLMIATKVDNDALTRQQKGSAPRNAYEEISPLDHKPDSNRPFAAYKSPLGMLKSFRFHPQFTDLVPNGYRSLTYSNQVDVNRPLCATELQGKICTDTECEDQHFGAMSLSDDKILVQMSSAFDIKDKAQRDAYLIGLKKVIADLRERGVKEFSEVAGALSKYRREWQATQDGILV